MIPCCDFLTINDCLYRIKVGHGGTFIEMIYDVIQVPHRTNRLYGSDAFFISFYGGLVCTDNQLSMVDNSLATFNLDANKSMLAAEVIR